MEASREGRTQPYPGYRTLWIWLLLGWAASGVDRTITGPVMSYIINNELPLIQGSTAPTQWAVWSAACCLRGTC